MSDRLTITRSFEFKTTSTRSIVIVICRLCIGVVFVLASIPKVISPYLFLSSVLGYEIVTGEFAKTAVIVLPWLELVLAALLISGLWLRGCFLLSSFMCGLFALAQASALHRGLFIPCGCFGEASAGGSTVGYLSIGRTGALLMVSVVGFILASKGAMRSQTGD